MVSTTGKKIILGSVVAILAIIIGLVASSLKRLSTEEAGIKYDVIQRVLDTSLYTAGVYYQVPLRQCMYQLLNW